MKSFCNIAFSLTAALLLLAGLSAPVQAASLVFFWRDHCAPCRAWEEEIGKNYAQSPQAKRALLRRVDVAQKRPPHLARLSPITSLPTFVLLSDGGKEVGRIVGYGGVQMFWGQMRQLFDALDAVEQAEELQASSELPRLL